MHCCFMKITALEGEGLGGTLMGRVFPMVAQRRYWFSGSDNCQRWLHCCDFREFSRAWDGRPVGSEVIAKLGRPQTRCYWLNIN